MLYLYLGPCSTRQQISTKGHGHESSPGSENIAHIMHDLAIAATFVLIVLSPCFVAARVGIEADMQTEE
jgi:hypothetical protein